MSDHDGTLGIVVEYTPTKISDILHPGVLQSEPIH